MPKSIVISGFTYKQKGKNYPSQNLKNSGNKRSTILKIVNEL